jgi:hypothetical protein
VIHPLSKLIGVTLLAIAPAFASVSIYVPPEQLARTADLVVEATVERTASGFDPVQGTLSTYVTLRVGRVHRGPNDLRRLVIREAGGRHGDRVHAVDAVPDYTAGERVLVFLEAAPDGSLRTAGMFYGKFRIDDAGPGALEAVRDLEGQGTILRGPMHRVERIALSDLESTVATAIPRRLARMAGSARAPRFDSTVRQSPPEAGWTLVPAAFDRLVWEDVVEIPDGSGLAESVGSTPIRELAAGSSASGSGTDFIAADPAAPARWAQADSGTPVTFHLQQGNDPLGNGAAAVAEVRRAMAAWTSVPESRLALQAGNTNFNYMGTYGASPAVSYSGVNVVLFGDPYGDISDPVNCGGVLAVGGYWRSGTLSQEQVNGVSFYPAMQAYVIFNNGFDCFLGDPDNLAEVAAHELGHGLGFGHSAESDSIMRSFAYGFRGARLADDDRDAAHCHYPHTLQITSPNGGEEWAAGSLQTVTWASTAESGPDPGVVDVEYSTNGGSDWTSIAAGTPNDGSHTWSVPLAPSDQTRVRVVRYPLGGGLQAAFPEGCSGDGSDASFVVVEEPPVAGAVPDGTTGAPLRIEQAGAGQLRLSWGASCSAATDNYAVYEGSLVSLRGGAWDHASVSCSGSDVVEYVNPSAGDRFFLVAPLAGATEGDLGVASSGSPRPEPASACGVRQAGLGCNP